MKIKKEKWSTLDLIMAALPWLVGIGLFSIASVFSTLTGIKIEVWKLLVPVVIAFIISVLWFGIMVNQKWE